MKTQQTQNIIEVWNFYWETQEIEYRDSLIEFYLPLVKSVVHRLISGMPSHVKTEDLYASGVEGLVRAVERYNPERSRRFEGYAVFLIKAAIIDDLRKQDWVPRSVHQKANKLSGAMDSLRQSLGKEPTDLELCEYLNISQQELSGWFVSARPALIVSLNEEWPSQSDEGAGMALEERIPDERAETGYDVVDKQEFSLCLANAIQELEEKERKVMALYYYEELVLKEIGKVLGVSESRVSQIHSKALLKLRAALSAFR
ncbi:transcription initiation factor sigmaD protein [Chlamydia pneumoniae TW-183]|uniref:RNA polymerase sigma factor WhiG n=2 Tax=Chlamydia pneumoniae TaxID=83558 RepID=Q9Z8I1_CHLPN|nr:FliA/WhiG family RNA polymerase sigma factor [Chlamydia pneumoniae]AAD18506.1 Sigma-28/WhiG Family [Chlamydia pneumoniae CWL029]AAF38240.1 RNA polymerase sigma factor, sigma-70 family [Chlamydia pneumoniae AR39]AAP98303.1 transcription initiation factor sigmaD protein [Chlamydia pneumoniae TW-183]ACZ33337.1 RNA polymerase sigma factor, FliA [Chlamydia pneumoniae LPCoLN]CRI32863.1 RNA polymerase sigma factor WhiG [Chlamydia pneumoniae]